MVRELAMSTPPSTKGHHKLVGSLLFCGNAIGNSTKLTHKSPSEILLRVGSTLVLQSNS